LLALLNSAEGNLTGCYKFLHPALILRPNSEQGGYINFCRFAPRGARWANSLVEHITLYVLDNTIRVECAATKLGGKIRAG